jgi:hypothetical protein
MKKQILITGLVIFILLACHPDKKQIHRASAIDYVKPIVLEKDVLLDKIRGG